MWGLKEMKWSTANHIWIQSESPPRGLNDSNFRQHIGESQQNPMREEEPEMSQLFSLIWDCFLHPFCKPAPTVLFPEIFLWQDGSTVFKRSSKAADRERGKPDWNTHFSPSLSQGIGFFVLSLPYLYKRDFKSRQGLFISRELWWGLNLTVPAVSFWTIINCNYTRTNCVSSLFNPDHFPDSVRAILAPKQACSCIRHKQPGRWQEYFSNTAQTKQIIKIQCYLCVVAHVCLNTLVMQFYGPNVHLSRGRGCHVSNHPLMSPTDEVNL